MTNRPEVIAHRGASDERPENTMVAFLRALELGAEAIELDVHATSDGVVVVHHDPAIRLGRQEDPAALVVSICDERFDELRELRVKGEPIPTLDDVLRQVAGRATVYIEVKGHGIEEAVVASIRRSAAPERCAVHSFDHTVARRVHELAPEVPTGILLASYLVDPAHALKSAGARDYWQHWELVDDALADAVHEAGGRLIAWTPWDSHDLIQLADDGVDGLCVDAPDRALEIFRRRQ